MREVEVAYRSGAESQTRVRADRRRRCSHEIASPHKLEHTVSEEYKHTQPIENEQIETGFEGAPKMIEHSLAAALAADKTTTHHALKYNDSQGLDSRPTARSQKVLTGLLVLSVSIGADSCAVAGKREVLRAHV